MRHQPASLDPLFKPRSIALIGASDDVTRIGGRPLRYLREGGFEGAVYPVNPKRDTVQGIKSYDSVAALPEIPDVAILAVPAQGTVQALRDCADRKVKAAVVFSAGFAEASEQGRLAQDQIAGIARESGMRVLGPNCLGLFNAGIGYYGTFSAILDAAFVEPGPIAVVSQSGAYGSHIAHLARQRSLGIGQWITTGNECDIDVAEALRWVIDQPDVGVVMAYAEGIRDRDTFIEALEVARAKEKAIVFLKVGRSDVGAQAVSSHTAALAGSDAVFDAVLRQYGAYRARTTAEHLDATYACARGLYPAGNRFGIFTLSGGFGIQMADDASACGLDVAPMPEAAQDELKAMLPYASPRNPVDATAQALTDLPLMTSYIAAMLEKGDYHLFAGIFGSGPASPTFSASLRQALRTATAGHQGRILALSMSAPPEIVRTYEDDGFLIFEDGSALVNALAALVWFRRSFDAAKQARTALTAGSRIAPPDGALSEHEAKSLLQAAGIAFPKEALVRPDEDAGAAATAIGFPVVVKICSPDIAHKTEIGGVIVGPRDEAQAREAARTILSNARHKRPDARIEGVIVSPMIRGGVETIVGVVRDPSFGPVVMFGLGGVLVEVLKDVTFRVAPFDVAEAQRMIREIRGFAVLEGVRGAPPADVDALAAMLSRLSQFAADNADVIESIDLNPVLVMPRGEGVMPLDALLVPRSAASRD
ncbi:acetate--CoA ligase family protein [Bradyrhizobium sp. CCGUVB1N3]|uniref:acetate--CoA ligase family protein n=1 Tax=Bradyrhizobium sp. CCGUVB1N3 TaxID=2949629 RepID=UPI0020B1F8AF|nr:acetate--CoA ligase family protein [Bradyrhizobium sp. CCGUVB1N3]MCP3468819.1 acetate--CoA ligase family protein [Bradyrhizobium sp. CCGUVB1N3]